MGVFFYVLENDMKRKKEVLPEGMKCCICGCEQIRPEDEFTWRNKEKGIRDPRLRECRRRIRKEKRELARIEY